jgi:hypothetical protein
MQRILLAGLLLLAVTNVDAQLKVFRDSSRNYGFKDASGQVVVSPIYTRTAFFVEGFCGVVRKVKTDDGYMLSKWGFIDTTGREVIAPMFDDIGSFEDGFCQVELKGKKGVINKKGALVVPAIYSEIESFTDGMAPVAIPAKEDPWGEENEDGDKLWGFVDIKGRQVIPPAYEEVGDFAEGLFAVKKDGKWGFINLSNQVVIAFQFDWVGHFEDGLAAVEKGEESYFIDKKGKKTDPKENFPLVEGRKLFLSEDFKAGFRNEAGTIVIPAKYDAADNFSGGLARVFLNGKGGFIDKTGKAVVPLKYDMVYEFQEGFAVVNKGYQEFNEDSVLALGKFGFVNRSGIEVIPLKYDDAFGFQVGIAPVNLGKTYRNGKLFSEGKWGFIDNKGKEITAIQYDWIDTLSDGMYLVNKGIRYQSGKLLSGGKFGYVNTGGEVIPLQFDDASAFIRGRAEVIKDGKRYLIDKTGAMIQSQPQPSNKMPVKKESIREDKKEEIVSNEISDPSKWVSYTEGRLYGLKDRNGKIMIAARYESIALMGFSEGLLPVQLNEKWGYIDVNGKEVIPCIYDHAERFTEGMGMVCQMKNKKCRWGFVNKKGELVIPCEYNYAMPFLDGKSEVTKGNKKFFIDKAGKPVSE